MNVLHSALCHYRFAIMNVIIYLPFYIYCNLLLVDDNLMFFYFLAKTKAS